MQPRFFSLCLNNNNNNNNGPLITAKPPCLAEDCTQPFLLTKQTRHTSNVKFLSSSFLPAALSDFKTLSGKMSLEKHTYNLKQGLICVTLFYRRQKKKKKRFCDLQGCNAKAIMGHKSTTVGCGEYAIPVLPMTFMPVNRETLIPSPPRSIISIISIPPLHMRSNAIR